MLKRPLIEQQRIIIVTIRENWPHNISVNAGPGVGKTFICKRIMHQIEKDCGKKSCIFLSFNKQIRSEVANDTELFRNEQDGQKVVHTYHSFTGKILKGWRWKQLPNYPNGRTQYVTISSLLKKFIDSKLLTLKDFLDTLNFNVEIYNIEKKQGFCFDEQHKEHKLRSIRSQKEKDLQTELDNVIEAKEYDFTITVFLVGYILMNSNRYDYEYNVHKGITVIVDEAQDIDPWTFRILKTCVQGQTILIGDNEQQINVWNGAINAIEKYDNKINLSMMTVFRFGLEVCRLRNNIFKRHRPGRQNLIPSESAPNTKVISWSGRFDNDFVSMSQTGTVLFRSNEDIFKFAEQAVLSDLIIAIDRNNLKAKKSDYERKVKEINLEIEEIRDRRKRLLRQHRHPHKSKRTDNQLDNSYVTEEKANQDLNKYKNLIEITKRLIVNQKQCVDITDEKAKAKLTTVHKFKGNQTDIVLVHESVTDCLFNNNELNDEDFCIVNVGLTRVTKILFIPENLYREFYESQNNWRDWAGRYAKFKCYRDCLKVSKALVQKKRLQDNWRGWAGRYANFKCYRDCLNVSKALVRKKRLQDNWCHWAHRYIERVRKNIYQKKRAANQRFSKTKHNRSEDASKLKPVKVKKNNTQKRHEDSLQKKHLEKYGGIREMGLLEPSANSSIAQKSYYMDRLFKINGDWIHAELKNADHTLEAYHQIDDYRYQYDLCRSARSGYELQPKQNSKLYYNMSDYEIREFINEQPIIRESWVVLFGLTERNKSFLPALKNRYPDVRQMEILSDGTHREITFV